MQVNISLLKANIVYWSILKYHLVTSLCGIKSGNIQLDSILSVSNRYVFFRICVSVFIMINCMFMAPTCFTTRLCCMKIVYKTH